MTNQMTDPLTTETSDPTTNSTSASDEQMTDPTTNHTTDPATDPTTNPTTDPTTNPTINQPTTNVPTRINRSKKRPQQKIPLQCSTRNQKKPRRSKRAKTTENRQQSTADEHCLGDLATMCRSECTFCSKTFEHHSDWVVAKMSKIQGKGVFAKQTIPPNTFLVKYLGNEVSSVKEGQRYVIQLRNKYLDAEDYRGIHKYVNHCCDGNKYSYQRSARFHMWCDKRGVEHVSIVTNRQVEKGEEIFVNYGSDYLIQDCCCPNCRIAST